MASEPVTARIPDRDGSGADGTGEDGGPGEDHDEVAEDRTPRPLVTFQNAGVLYRT
jgi:hypothetical protein